MKYPSQAVVGHFHKLCERRELQHKSDGKLTWGRLEGVREPSTSVPLSENGTTSNAKGLLSEGAFSSLGQHCLALLVTFALPAGANSSPVLTPFFTPLAWWCIYGLGCVTLFFWHGGDEETKCTP